MKSMLPVAKITEGLAGQCGESLSLIYVGLDFKQMNAGVRFALTVTLLMWGGQPAGDVLLALN